MGSCRGGEARGGEGRRDSGFAGTGVGFLCVRTSGPRGRHLQRWAHNADGPTLCEAAPAPSLRPPAGRSSSSSRKGAGWGTRRDAQEPSPGGTAGPRPALRAPDSQPWFPKPTRPAPCLPHSGLIVPFYGQRREKVG